MTERHHPPRSTRVFKTAWFSKAAKKARISDADLCAAVNQVMQGQADDLGGGVFKKRLNDNLHRSIIIAKGGRYWVYEYLFAKKDRDNIEADELAAFRVLAKAYASLSEAQTEQLLRDKDLMEICHDVQAKIQK
jgi:hypothetical protein